MTDVIKFVFNCLNDTFKLGLSLTFDLFGFEVSFFSIILSILILIAVIKLLKFGFTNFSKFKNED